MTIDPRYYGLIEMAMTFGVVAVFTVQQLWSLRDKPGDNHGDNPGGKVVDNVGPESREHPDNTSEKPSQD